MITPAQALDARFYLSDAADEAMLAHYFDGHKLEHIAQLHCTSFEKSLAKAVERLGFKLVSIEDNQPKVLEGGEQ